jgi:hypothetical protein
MTAVHYQSFDFSSSSSRSCKVVVLAIELQAIISILSSGTVIQKQQLLLPLLSAVAVKGLPFYFAALLISISYSQQQQHCTCSCGSAKQLTAALGACFCRY